MAGSVKLVSQQLENLSVQEKSASSRLKPQRPAPPPPARRATAARRAQYLSNTNGKAPVPSQPSQLPQDLNDLQRDTQKPRTSTFTESAAACVKRVRKCVTAATEELQKKPVPPKRSSSLREYSTVRYAQSAEKDSTQPSLPKDLEVATVMHNVKGNTFPRTKSDSSMRRANTLVEGTNCVARKKKRKPHVIDARPTRYEAIDSHQRRSWLEKLKSKKTRRHSPVVDTINQYTPCVEKRRHHSVLEVRVDVASLCKDLTPQKPPNPPLRSLPPASLSKERAQLPLPLLPASSPTPLHPTPIAAEYSQAFKRPPMPLPSSPSSPSSLPPITEFEDEDDDSGTIATEDEDNIPPYSIVTKDMDTGRFISVFTTDRITQSLDATASNTDEYIYPVCKWQPASIAGQETRHPSSGTEGKPTHIKHP